MKKRGKINKKALSPVIATVLLVLLVIALALFIFFWARGFFSEQLEKSGESVENICTNVRFDANINGQNLEVVNRGTISISGFSIKVFHGGNSKTEEIIESANVGESFSRNVGQIYVEGTPDKVTVYPILLAQVRGGKERKHYTCKEGKTITL
jgi:flagellin-like protein